VASLVPQSGSFISLVFIDRVGDSVCLIAGPSDGLLFRSLVLGLFLSISLLVPVESSLCLDSWQAASSGLGGVPGRGE